MLTQNIDSNIYYLNDIRFWLQIWAMYISDGKSAARTFKKNALTYN